MNENTARACLRLLAVATVLVGVILTVTTILSILAAGSAMQGAVGGMQIQMTGMVAKMGFWAVVSQASIAGWGLVLWAMSPSLAQKLVE